MDVFLENHGSIILLRPVSLQAHDWLHMNLEPDAQWFGNAAVVEPRYLSDIIEGMHADGLGVAA